MEYFRISISLNGDRISDPYVWQIFLVDIDQHPDGPDVGNHEALRGTRLDELSRGHILLNHQAVNRSLYWNLKGSWGFHEVVGIDDPHAFKCGLGCSKVAARLYFGR